MKKVGCGGGVGGGGRGKDGRGERDGRERRRWKGMGEERR